MPQPTRTRTAVVDDRVKPLKGIAPWFGGKRGLAKILVPMIEAVPHTCYAEPFIGMGGVFLRRRRRPKVEAINDRNGEVANLFRVLQRHPQAFLEELRFRLTCRADFNRLRATDPTTLTDLERASRFYQLQRSAFAGKVGGVFAASPITAPRFDVTKLPSQIEALHARLAGVNVDCLDYAEFIRRWDRPGTLFYLDPPYWGYERHYGKNLFDRSAFEAMAEQLGGLQGRFIMSLNDVPEIRAIFARFRIERVGVTYKIEGTKLDHELLITTA